MAEYRDIITLGSIYLEYNIILETMIPKITSKTVNSTKTPATVPAMTGELGTR